MNLAVNSQQTNYHRTGCNYFKSMVPIIFLLVILFFGAWVRFDGITKQGVLLSSDHRKYIKEAKLCAAGQPPTFISGKFYRPAPFFLMGMAIRIFGDNDYSIKMLHGILDMINIFLIFIIAAKLAKNKWVGTISSLLYAFLPKVILYVRRELVHTESTFFVLLAFFFFVLFARRETGNRAKFILLSMSGLCLGLAVNTHMDIAFLGPGYVLFLLITSYNSKKKKESLKKFLLLAVIFTFSFFIPYFVGFLLLGPKTALNVILNEISALDAYSSSKSWWIQDTGLPNFYNILHQSFTYCFSKQIIPAGILLIGAIFIMIYRKIKKEKDHMLAYLPLILIFCWVFFYSSFAPGIMRDSGRYFLPLVPLVIITISVWYYKIFKQLFGNYSSIVFVCLFLMLFIVNPKVIPGKIEYKSRYRLVYDILKDEVNSGNKLLIAPLTHYSFDGGFQYDFYFDKNAIYMMHLPIKNEYNLKSLKELLKDKNIRYIFLGKSIDRRLLDPNFHFHGEERYKTWLRNDKNPYSLEKDLEIIHSYIRSKGGYLINQSRFGKIYYLTQDEEEPGLITYGSFEHWWKGFPMGNWKLDSGRISRSSEATDGSSSIRFEPDGKKGSRIVRYFGNLFKDEEKLRVRLDVKADKTCKFGAFFTAGINGKRQVIKPGMVRYTGKGDWMTMGNDFTITPDMKGLLFHLRLFPGAREPAFVDNLSIIVIRNSE